LAAEQSALVDAEDSAKAQFEDKLLVLQMAIKAREEEVRNSESDRAIL
jgi:hypothetical protein